MWWMESRRRRDNCGVSQLLLTLLVPRALRRDTQWLPLELHLALLILQCSPQEEEEGGGVGAERDEKMLEKRG